jgi:Tfp pilus assembly protein PilF
MIHSRGGTDGINNDIITKYPNAVILILDRHPRLRWTINMMNEKQRRPETTATLVAIYLLIFCCGCQTVRPHSSPTEVQLGRVLSGTSLLGERAAGLPLPEDDIFEITPGMRDFLQKNVRGPENDYTMLQRLMAAVTDPSLLGWEYNTFRTYGARDSFINREGNCISYAIMMVALGRELGLDIHFNEVRIPPTWDMQTTQSVVLFRHVNVLAIVERKRMVLELNIEEYDSSFPQHIITDIAAEAHYYNNRGVDYLNADDTEQAFLNLRKALALQPDQSFIWGNMGVLHLRHGHHREAEAAFLHALELNPSDLTAISNLHRLYLKQGKADLADYYREKAERSRMSNPYYRFSLAGQLLENNRPDTALKHIKWAIRKYDREHRFHFLAAKIYARLGRQNEVEKSLEMAAKLSEDEKNRLRYQSKIARLRELSRQKSAPP